MLKKFLGFIALILSLTSCLSEDPVVETSDGKILGRVHVTAEQKKFYAFEKIPYAAAPIGDLRFQPPQRIKKWDGILNTTRLEVCCFQILGKRYLGVESEDCLFLNVYTPKLDGEYLPVMVYIHGGNFRMGTSAEYPPDTFVNNDVIFVTVNYRMGVFGFLSTEDDIMPGNLGLKDQSSALKWVQRNIRFFGGNSSKVTLCGHSSGATSVSYHLFNLKSPDLFQAVIIQSSSSLCDGDFQRNPRKTAFAIGAILNSTFQTSNNSEELFKYLQNISAERLNSAAVQFSINYTAKSDPWGKYVSQDNPWGPLIEPKDPDAFLAEKMYGLLKNGRFLAVPVMIGITTEEALMDSSLSDPAFTKKIASILDENLDRVVPGNMRITDLDKLKEKGELIRNMYTNGEAFSDNLGGFVQYCSDNGYTRAVIKQGELLSKFTKTYFYQFSYDGMMGNHTVTHYQGADTVGHCEELFYLFCVGTSCTDPKYPKSDYLTRQRLIRFWTNFIKYHNPTPEPEEVLQYITWPHITAAKNSFLYLNINNSLQIQNHPKEESYRGWNKLYDELDFDDFDTF